MSEQETVGVDAAETSDESSEDTTLCLQNMPPAILDAIFSHFTYSFAISLRHLSSSFHRAVVHKFHVGFAALLPRISKVMRNIEAQILNCVHQMNDYESARPLIGLNSKYSFVKGVFSEAKVLRATCRRHVEQGVWNYISAFGAFLLDHFDVILAYAYNDFSEDSAESTMTSELLFLSSQHMEHFCHKVEPNLGYKVPMEVKIADVIDCAQDCSYRSTLIERETSYTLKSTLFINSMNSIDFPWDVFEDISIDDKLECLLKSITNNVRFTNYINSMRETWLMEDILDRRGHSGLKSYFAGPKHYHREADGTEVPCKTIHHAKEWRRFDASTKVSDELYKNSDCADSFCIDVTLILEGGLRPLSLPPGCTTEERGSFELQIYAQYPSREDLGVNKSCIRASGKDGVYTLKSHNHHLERYS